MNKKHLFYIEAKIEVEVILSVVAVDEQEAFARANDGAWHGVDPHNYDKSRLLAVGKFTKGPGIN